MGNAAIIEGFGFAAAGLVLATFCMRGMRTLRFARTERPRRTSMAEIVGAGKRA